MIKYCDYDSVQKIYVNTKYFKISMLAWVFYRHFIIDTEIESVKFDTFETRNPKMLVPYPKVRSK
jgi:hypothetical protein